MLYRNKTKMFCTDDLNGPKPNQILENIWNLSQLDIPTTKIQELMVIGHVQWLLVFVLNFGSKEVYHF
jgi:hypothetical protein